MIYLRQTFIVLLLVSTAYADVQQSGYLQTVPFVAARPEWQSFKILIWSYQTDIFKDFDLYRKLNIGGFHIDRGTDQSEKVNFSLQHNFPYYVDHAAGKGILYLSGKNRENVVAKKELLIRPHSLADPKTLADLKSHLEKNVNATKNGFVLAYAFDDEISLGALSSPADTDIHPASLAWFRTWLKTEYGSIEALNREWNADFKNFDQVMPSGFEQIRQQMKKPRLADWNLPPWIDFRQFMDFQFSVILAELVRYTNQLAPDIPAGFVGGQGAGPWGGYDYAKLSRSVQWMEAYNIHESNEILRSFWNADRRPRMQTFFSTKNPKADSWFLWYYLLHGNQGSVAWPEDWFHQKDQEIAAHILANAEIFKEIQGDISKLFVSPTSRFISDPIGIYYSHPSIQLSWATDAMVHGGTWHKRLASMDDDNQSAGILRKVWCKTLEDLGFQYEFVSYLDVKEQSPNLNQRFEVIILPKVMGLSDKEAAALKNFVQHGGILIADYLCGIFDEHGKGRSKGVLDDVFGIQRPESPEYLNGKGISDIDAEKYDRPLSERFTFYDGAKRYKGIVMFERGIEPLRKNGNSVYLNLSPMEYVVKRDSEYGREWRNIISQILESAGLTPRVRIYENDKSPVMIESLFWKSGDKTYLGLVRNPMQYKNLDDIVGNESHIRLEFRDIVQLINLRTGLSSCVGKVFEDRFKSWQANVYEIR